MTIANIQAKGDLEVLVTREVDAPPEDVWRAWTTPEHFGRWAIGRQGTPTELRTDLRVGGQWRSVMKTPDGTEVATYGEYRELDPPHKLVSTEVEEAMPDAETVSALTLVALAGNRTQLQLHKLFETRERRDAYLSSEAWQQESLGVLEEISRELGS